MTDPAQDGQEVFAVQAPAAPGSFLSNPVTWLILLLFATSPFLGSGDLFMRVQASIVTFTCCCILAWMFQDGRMRKARYAREEDLSLARTWLENAQAVRAAAMADPVGPSLKVCIDAFGPLLIEARAFGWRDAEEAVEELRKVMPKRPGQGLASGSDMAVALRLVSEVAVRRLRRR